MLVTLPGKAAARCGIAESDRPPVRRHRTGVRPCAPSRHGARRAGPTIHRVLPAQPGARQGPGRHACSPRSTRGRAPVRHSRVRRCRAPSAPHGSHRSAVGGSAAHV